MHARPSRRELLVWGSVYLAGLGVFAYQMKNMLHAWQETEPLWGKPVELDEEGNLIVRYGELKPIQSDNSIPVRKRPSGNSPHIGELEYKKQIAVIEVYGSEYPSKDDRGSYYQQTVLGVELRYGRWFEINLNGNKGYVSGNFVTLLPESKEELNENGET